jgi:hypothetical protein
VKINKLINKSNIKGEKQGHNKIVSVLVIFSIVNLWFKKAESDFKTIENNLKSNDPPTDAICFHAQQAIEKYMKGALVYFEKHITKTHDLVNLLPESCTNTCKKFLARVVCAITIIGYRQFL